MDWHPVISVQQQTPDNDFCHFSISNVRFAFWAFFRKPEKLGSHTGSKWWPGDPDPYDPLTRWPNDPVPRLLWVCSVGRCVRGSSTADDGRGGRLPVRADAGVRRPDLPHAHSTSTQRQVLARRRTTRPTRTFLHLTPNIRNILAKI